MKQFQKAFLLSITLVMLFANIMTIQGQIGGATDPKPIAEKTNKNKENKTRLPEIDLSNWKVTLPVANAKGKPYEIEPPEISEFASNEIAKPYMYIDSTEGAIVFHAYPTNSTTRNTKYSRTELREQMKPGSNKVNWTFAQGATMKGKLSMEEVSRDKNGKHHKVIIMQIHGRLTNEQRDAIGSKDNNAPPILKIYWQNGKIRVKTKVLKEENLTGNALLHKDAWGDDKGFYFEEKVGYNKFDLEVKVAAGEIVVILNDNESKVYKNIHMEKWGIFDNYFKAGNYFQSRDEGSFAKVKYYELEVSH